MLIWVSGLRNVLEVVGHVPLASVRRSLAAGFGCGEKTDVGDDMLVLNCDGESDDAGTLALGP